MERSYKYIHKKHTYLIDDAPATGVTTFLKSGGDKDNLIQWAGNQDSAEAFKIASAFDLDGLVELKLFVEQANSYKKLDAQAVKELETKWPWYHQARVRHLMIRDRAGDTGHDAHEMVEAFENGLEVNFDKYPELAVKRAKGHIEWYKNNVEKSYFTERPLFSRTMMIDSKEVKTFIGGTPDGGWLMKDGKNLIKDSKFKTGLYSPHPVWQTATYMAMIKGMSEDMTTPVHIDWGDGRVEDYSSAHEYVKSFGDVVWHGSIIAQVDEDGKVEPVYRFAFEEDLRRALACLDIYRGTEAWIDPSPKWSKKNNNQNKLQI